MKNNNILEKFRNKLRILNYSKNTINMYCVFVKEFLTKTNKDSYNLTYRNISFERECYDNQHNLDYLKTRKFFNWINYIIWNKN